MRFTEHHIPDALPLNNAHAAELSHLDADRLRSLLRQAFHAEVIGPDVGKLDAFLIALDETAAYDSPNYAWVRARYERFAYVDRLVVAPAARGRGLARQLYSGLLDAARMAGYVTVLCEVNQDPPNPASDALHASLGFREVGAAPIHGGRKVVRYLARNVP